MVAISFFEISHQSLPTKALGTAEWLTFKLSAEKHIPHESLESSRSQAPLRWPKFDVNKWSSGVQMTGQWQCKQVVKSYATLQLRTR